MSVRIDLDQSLLHFTNLDHLSGRVIIALVADASVSAVTVKLEGESRSRLAAPKQPYSPERSDRTRTEFELHKVSEDAHSILSAPRSDIFEPPAMLILCPSYSTKSRPSSPIRTFDCRPRMQVTIPSRPAVMNTPSPSNCPSTTAVERTVG